MNVFIHVCSPSAGADSAGADNPLGYKILMLFKKALYCKIWTHLHIFNLYKTEVVV